MADLNRPRLLVTGGSGQVGGELLQTLAPLGTVVAPSRAELDLADPTSIRACIRAVRPRWIVNAGAYTAVDRAESEPDLAFAINADAVRILGEEAKVHNAAVIHFSTDYVFNGQGTRPYTETDPTGPLGVYGASKLAGEQALLRANPASLIFRTSWVYGATGKNFLLTILKLARERDNLRIVGDQHGAPTWSRDLAKMTAHVILQSEHGSFRKSGMPETLFDVVARLSGIYHAAGSGETTWAGFAKEAIHQVAKRELTALASVTSITTAEYPTAATRPKNSRLYNEKLERVFGYHMMEWRESLADVLGIIQSKRPLDLITRKAIHHLLRVWGQYSSSTGDDGHLYYEHQCMAAGENAGNFLMLLGLGREDGLGFSANEQGRAIAEDDSLEGDE